MLQCWWWGRACAAVLQAVEFHHERMDGTGYYNVAAAQLPILVRMSSIADVFAALTEDRSYRVALPEEHALFLLSKDPGHLDQELVVEFRRVFGRSEGRA